MDSFDLQDELTNLQDVSDYSFDNEIEIASLDPSGIAHVLEPAVDALAHATGGSDIMRGATLGPPPAGIGLGCGCDSADARRRAHSS